ncbi:MAG: nucleotide-binding universal stress UspA family protein [Gammaproteobacteria bacterium]|jgi:nucleotide-binding universal stress UspA family protein
MSNGISRILLATDGSEGSLRAARFVASLALPLAAHVTMLSVHSEEALMMQTMGPVAWPAALPDSGLNFEEIKAATEKQAALTTLQETKQALGNLPDVEIVQVWGQIAEAICDYASANSIDLIVIGSRGHSTFARLLLGSVSSQVAQHSPCPVTIVH